MRIASDAGRLILVEDGRSLDVAVASGGRFGPDPDDAYACWDEFVEWANNHAPKPSEPLSISYLNAPVREPSQVFAIGFNYVDHAAETDVAIPDSPDVLTKFQTCLSGPTAPIELPSPRVDWQVELVVVIGRRAEGVRPEQAWSHVAGLTVGQDISDRSAELSGTGRLSSLDKSYPGFGPIGPWVVTLDEFDDPDDLRLECSVDGRVLQRSRTSQMIFPVPELVSRISAVCPLLPGDVIFTGSPVGVAVARTRTEWLVPGTTLVSEIEGIGQLKNPVIGCPRYVPIALRGAA
jgi:2,4-diketo-3-deoxy-L-fuconate hydrolase